MAISKSESALIEQTLHSIGGLKLAYLFGSRAQGCSTSASDWDIAFLAQKPMAALDRWELAQALASELGADVDLIDLAEASTVMRMQVVTQGVRLYGKPYDADVFEMQVYSMYGRLQESREGILQDFIGELKDE